MGTWHDHTFVFKLKPGATIEQIEADFKNNEKYKDRFDYEDCWIDAEGRLILTFGASTSYGSVEELRSLSREIFAKYGADEAIAEESDEVDDGIVHMLVGRNPVALRCEAYKRIDKLIAVLKDHKDKIARSEMKPNGQGLFQLTTPELED